MVTGNFPFVMQDVLRLDVPVWNSLPETLQQLNLCRFRRGGFANLLSSDTSVGNHKGVR